MTAIQDYIRELRNARTVGVRETSGYGALQTLFNAVGMTLSPVVRCILHPTGGGGSLPDGGLFTPEQLQPLGRGFEPQAALRMDPARGVVEVKGTGDNLQTLIASEQVNRYLQRYGKVLCTNYREFAVVEQRGNEARVLEQFSFAPDESTFWNATNDLGDFAGEHEERFIAFLQRAMLYGAPLATPEAVAAFMASCAREAKSRVERADVPALDRVRSSLEGALNLSFPTAEADAFFRSSLVQTLFYGVFSAWVLWGRENPPDTAGRFDWRTSAHYLRVPVIQSLFYEMSNPITLQSLDIVEPLNWVTDALNRVDRVPFDRRFEDGTAVQYFYEPFLAAFDPKLRQDLGVWYTPVSIVRYMIERVDQALKTELGIAGGLADERVVVLDPCCGTGGFLVEVIRHINATLQARGEDALSGSDLKSAVLSRLFGFELLTAPFVAAHLQLGLLMQTLGAPLGEGERARIFLTNALTGWSEPDGDQLRIELPGLQEEREAAGEVKQQERVLVILGNPPYSGFAGIAIGEERELSNAYRETRDPALPAPEGQGLNELFVRFYRMAERKIAQQTGEGIVCYITNYSWLDGKSHSGMREAFLDRFSGVWIDSLNGDRYRTGKRAPDGSADPSIFSTAGNPVGIQVGTAIALLVKKPGDTPGDAHANLHYRDLWGTGKHAQLEAETQGRLAPEYAILQPPVALGLPFMAVRSNEAYTSWPTLPELFPTSFPGVKTSRDEVVVDINRDDLIARMEAYFDTNVTHEQMRQIAPKVMADTSSFDAAPTRERLQARGFLRGNIVRYFYRPFDVRWLYWEPETNLLDRNRAEYWPHVFEENIVLAGVAQNRRQFEPPVATEQMCSLHVIERGANLFPLYLRDQTTSNLFADSDTIQRVPNLSNLSRAYLTVVDADAHTLFHHALAIQHAARYRADNADGLRLNWPRIPLPQTRAVLEASGTLGEHVARLLDPHQGVAGVTTGAIRRELQIVGGVARAGGGTLDPDRGDIRLSASWGRLQGGAVMPGAGRAVDRAWEPAEMSAIEAGALALGLDLQTALLHLGERAYDVYLNDIAFWKGVPSRVWEYQMGGYRVLKKWLSYRDVTILGRDLKSEEVRELRDIARRIAVLLLLEPQLDANYAACSAATWGAAGGE